MLVGVAAGMLVHAVLHFVVFAVCLRTRVVVCGGPTIKNNVEEDSPSAGRVPVTLSRLLLA